MKVYPVEAKEKYLINSTGINIKIGSAGQRYYCGRVLGLELIPGSVDGQFGPSEGPQCPDCLGISAVPICPKDHDMPITPWVYDRQAKDGYSKEWCCFKCNKNTSSQSKEWKTGRYCCLKCKVDCCIDCKSKWIDGHFPVNLACSNGHLEVVKYLKVIAEADMNRADGDDNTPFYVACSNGQLEIVKYLREDAGVDSNKAKNNGATPFYVACEKGHLEVLKYLREEAGADTNKPNNNGATPFYVACQEGHLEVRWYINIEKTRYKFSLVILV